MILQDDFQHLHGLTYDLADKHGNVLKTIDRKMHIFDKMSINVKRWTIDVPVRFINSHHPCTHMRLLERSQCVLKSAHSGDTTVNVWWGLNPWNRLWGFCKICGITVSKESEYSGNAIS